ncbi:hypothetical protein AX17_001267 [Amanita inopinata Kibby_2008]|nr:hypothetical protein AX17_001267 [Amanita inopinata Kibby_2008]
MSFANINDSAAVSALLEQLKASKAWKDVIDSHPDRQQSDVEHPHDPAPASSTSVARLLSQLQPSSSRTAEPPSRARTLAHPPHTSTASLPSDIVPVVRDEPTAGQERRDIKSYTFQQALPVLAKLSSDPAFVAKIGQLKKAQDELERRLWEERREIQRKHEEKVKVTKTKANMIGVGISKHEADMMNDACKKELEKFDRDRVLQAWDGLVAKQQATLAESNVPTMSVTSEKGAREVTYGLIIA